MSYKWAFPHDWLMDQAEHHWTPEQVLCALREIVSKCDADTLQDIFQTEMDTDGYFQEIA
jgi:hypothetical protein